MHQLFDDLESVAETWQDLLQSETAWVAEDTGQVVGFCVREEDNIAGLYVKSEARGQGIGKSLLDLAKRNRTRISVWVYELNERARAFYQREGLQ